MRVAVCGGGLQGVELCLLAREAGWRVLLIDRRPGPPALYLAERFLRADFTHPGCREDLRRALAATDLAFPALENPAALAELVGLCATARTPLAFDPAAYAVSSSKLRSRELFLALSIPVPAPRTGEAVFPLLAKPSGGSGSAGVRVFTERAEFRRAFPTGTATPDWVFEEFCPGPSYSLEVSGRPGRYATHLATALHMDEGYDCKAVSAPAGLTAEQEAELRGLALRLAEALALKGLMDLEVVAVPDGLRVLEIDARFPSQTPLTVLAAGGPNLAVELAQVFLAEACAAAPPGARPSAPFVRYEQILCAGARLSCSGERVMAGHGPLRPCRDFYGADLALLSGQPADPERTGPAWQSGWSAPTLPAPPWAATLIFLAASAGELAAKRRICLDEIARAAGLSGFSDPEPAL